MGYIRAEEILPIEVIELIQQYVDGENIYIPRKSSNRQAWGAGTQIKQELLRRDQQIYKDFLTGSKTLELACKYYLSEKSILGDYIACCIEEEKLLRSVYLKKRKQSAMPEHCYVHFDIPLTLEHEKELLQNAGFVIEGE